MRYNPYIMSLAVLEAEKSPCSKRQVGAVILSKYGEFLGKGFNAPPEGFESCPTCWKIQNGGCPAIHAEVAAVIDALRKGFNPVEGVLYTTLEPCPSCLRFIYELRIGRVYYLDPYRDKDEPLDEELRKKVKLIQVELCE